MLALAERDQGTTDPDPGRVAALLPGWRKACDQGNDGEACGNLGALHALGKVLEKSEPKAFELYDKACRFGQGMRCVRAGVMALNGRGTEVSVAKAAALFRQGCRVLSADACVNYYAVTHGKTITYEGETVPMPAGMIPEKAEPAALQNVVTVLTLACTRGLGKACGNLAGMIEEGDAAPRDLAKALDYYLKACELGEAERCARAGRYLANNVPEPPIQADRAAKLFERHCELKKAPTCPMAVMARKGMPIELTLAQAPAKPAHVEPAQAIHAPVTAPESRRMVEAPRNTPAWARYPTDQPIAYQAFAPDVQALVKRCNQGDARACGNAGAALVDESGKPKLWPEAARQLFERACSLGRAQRCLDAARFHAHGWGTEKSAEREQAAVKRACELGHKASCNPVPAARMPAMSGAK